MTLKIAIIGYECMVPSCSNSEMFYNLLSNKKSGISKFDLKDIEEDISDNPSDYVPCKGYLKNVYDFDASFFGFSNSEAVILDPQHRLFLECVWNAIEKSGYNPFKIEGKVGVFGSCSQNSYLFNEILNNPSLISNYDPLQLQLGNDRDFLTTRVSYKLNFQGPSLTVQCGCSSSLVAVHLAGQSILNGECEYAVAGGVSIDFPLKKGYYYQDGMIYSRDGFCRPFNENSTGIVNGDGVGIVVLKDYEKAVQDNDTIYAVIRGSAVNNDGKYKNGFIAPSLDQQIANIQEAIDFSEVKYEEIDFIETHGTGTELGDKIELEALGSTYGMKKRSFPIILGAVKSNIGHLDVASGICSLIKTIMSFEYNSIFPNANILKPMSSSWFSDNIFKLPEKKILWLKTKDKKRFAAVNSLGMGGTNVHVILEEGNQNNEYHKEYIDNLFILSAKNSSLLLQSIDLYKKFFQKNRDLSISDICFTSQVGREHFEFRIAVICKSLDELIEKLSNAPIIQIKEKKGLKDCYSLKEMKEMWLSGYAINWLKLHENKIVKRIKLPTTIFEKQIYRIKQIKKIKKTEQTVSSLFSLDLKNHLKNIWQENLGIELINENDNFFEKGGDSINAIKLINQINQKYNLSLKAVILYQYPIFADLLKYCENIKKKGVSKQEKQELIKEEDFSDFIS